MLVYISMGEARSIVHRTGITWHGVIRFTDGADG